MDPVTGNYIIKAVTKPKKLEPWPKIENLLKNEL